MTIAMMMAAAISDVAVPTPLKLSETLTSHMVLQREPASARLWGWGTAGTTVSVAGIASTTVDSSSRWMLKLPPQAAGPAFGSGVITVVGADANVTMKDIHFGEVWLCTGQR